MSEAQKTFDTAVEEFVRTGDGPQGVVTGHVTVVAETYFDEDGESYTKYNMILMGGDLPLHVVMGLLDYAQTRYRRYAAEEGEEHGFG